MRGFLNGESSVAKVYWLGFVLTGFAFTALYRYINYLYLTSAETGFEWVELAHNVLIAFNVVWIAALLRAVVKSAYNNRTPGGWGWTAIVIMSLNLAYTSYVGCTLFFPKTYTPLFVLKLEIHELNKQLPQRIDEENVLTRMFLENKVLITHTKVDYEADDLMQEHLDWEFSTEVESSQELCEDLEGYFRAGLKASRAVYFFTNTTLSTELTAEECTAYLATRN
ncbi:hypothetical protein [Shimia sp. Alg240-R146]|uniref:hypothetical protein n=1 Tax=Shimia sp. Alg240-R146 TaxID=2993449 RepID=UPI0022E39EE2|nr:hypothetical protein [Shimia sp. Alg240-R146]